MLQQKLDSLTQEFKDNIITCRVEGDKGALVVLSDIHQGLNNRAYLQRTVDMLLKLGSNCKVIIGGDSTNTTTKHSKGDVLEEWAVGDKQVYALIDDIKPLYESKQLLGIISGNHNQRAYNDAYITIESMIACLLGDRSLYKGVTGVVYFNVNKNCYVHNILHKHRRTKHFYDYFNADVTWYEHFHELQATPKIIIDHNRYAKKVIPKVCWELKQGSFQTYPNYCKTSGIRPTLGGYWVCEMTGDVKNKMVIPYVDHVMYEMIERGYKL